MTQPLDINKLARETAQKLYPVKSNTRDRVEDFILAALTKLAAEKDAEIARHKAALKVATDALKHAQLVAVTMEHKDVYVTALQRITEELKP